MSTITTSTVPQPEVSGTEGIVVLSLPSGVQGGTYHFELTTIVAKQLSDALIHAAEKSEREIVQVSGP